MKVNRTLVVAILKALSKALPYVIAALGGGATVAAVSGCKLGSIVSLSTPL